MPIFGAIRTDRLLVATAPTTEPAATVYRSVVPSTGEMARPRSLRASASRSTTERDSGALSWYSRRSISRIGRAAGTLHRRAVFLFSIAAGSRPAELLEREPAQPVALPEQVLLEVRQHAVVPDALDSRIV